MTDCWKHMVSITRQISKKIQSLWPASRIVHKSSCTHCILKGESSPGFQVTPSWCHDFQTEKPYQQFQKKMVTVLCRGDKILSPLVYPCTPLTSQDTQHLRNTIAELREKKQERSSKSGKLPVFINV
ncbi:hypothetical protein EB796_007674 [Bugula neritina]|uniref:Uncharacterized protein n=1 Tax=Bugula neritina TaxID=10212 RepID=A0A7J7K8S1_BUGNE|nr:hypothetical protein EB796_007674 [Bugula neritina]